MINTLHAHSTHTDNCLVGSIDEKIHHVREGNGVEVT